jgi:hypothetical protein
VSSPCVVDLSKTDCYPDTIPDADVEVALKVIRTLRNMCLEVDMFDAEGAVLLSHTHKWIVEAVEEVQAAERKELESDA